MTEQPDATAEPAAVLILLDEVMPDEVPAAVQIRQWLKAGLRLWWLKCVAIQTTKPDSETKEKLA
jgi:hypothetical protein